MNERQWVCECEYEYSSRAIHIDQNWWCWHELWTRRNEAMTLRSAYDRFPSPPLSGSLVVCFCCCFFIIFFLLFNCGFGFEEFPCTRNWLNDFGKWFGYPKHISSESITHLYGPRVELRRSHWFWMGCFGHDINIIIKVSIIDTLAICFPLLPPLRLIEEPPSPPWHFVNNIGQVVVARLKNLIVIPLVATCLLAHNCCCQCCCCC